MPTTALPVLIVDDHELVGASLELGLRTEGLDARHVPPRDVDAVIGAARALSPGLVLLDLDLGRDAAGRPVDGVRLVPPLLEAGCRVLVLSGTSDHARVGAALAAGATSWVPKNAPFPALLGAVRAASEGRDAMPPDRRAQLVDLHHRRSTERGELAVKIDRLSPREREVLAALAQGMRAQAVADRFVVSLATVRTQIRAVLTKLEVGSQLEAVALYRRAGGRQVTVGSRAATTIRLSDGRPEG